MSIRSFYFKIKNLFRRNKEKDEHHNSSGGFETVIQYKTFKSIYLPYVVLFLLFIGLGTTVYQIQQQQETRSRGQVVPTRSPAPSNPPPPPTRSQPPSNPPPPPTSSIPTLTPTPEMECAQDLKRCPDGSYVRRIPPACTFVPCPIVPTNTPIPTSTPTPVLSSQGTLSAAPNPCTITSGSFCITNVTWSATNVSNITLVLDSTKLLDQSQEFSGIIPAQISLGNHNLALFANGGTIVLNAMVVTANPQTSQPTNTPIPPTPVRKIGDVDGNGIVNSLDLNEIVINFNRSGSNVPADLTRDGIVNALDFNEVVASYGR